MPRKDISNKLTHFTSGRDFEEAYKRLSNIIHGRSIIGSNSKIKGGYKCVCFTEAPLISLQDGLVNSDAYSRYLPFGVILDKKVIFDMGGRPVIYQTDNEFERLPEELKWRHMRYEPNDIDFTWEREWRIQCENLSITPNIAGIVVPNQEWAERIVQEHVTNEDYKIMEYSLIIDEEIAEMYREDFKWTVYWLR